DGRGPLEGAIDGPEKSFDLCSDVVPHAATRTCLRNAKAKLSSSMFMRKPQRRARAGDFSCATVRANEPRPPEKKGRKAVRRRSPPEPLLLRITMATWSRLQQGRQDVCLRMGKVRSVDGRYTVTLGNGQTGRFHGFQLAVRGGEAHPARARECADAPADPVNP